MVLSLGKAMRRRDFISGIAGSTAAWPLAARAQQPALPVIGFMHPLGRNDRPNLLEAFRRGLSEAGYVEGRNVAIEYRFAENQLDRLPALAADLVARGAAVIAATGGGNTILAAKAATATIPIVFTTAGDPVEQGYVASLNRPGGNVTGINWFGSQLVAKGLGMLLELVPNAVVIALMANPKLPETARMLSDAQEAARLLGRQFLVVNAGDASEIDAAFATLRRQRASALLVAGDPLYSGRRQQIVALAARDAIPAMYFNREFVAEGGLMSYGNDIADAYHQAGIYAGRILKGEKPADLPVMQSTRFEFVINLKTAKALGLEVSWTLSARAVYAARNDALRIARAPLNFHHVLGRKQREMRLHLRNTNSTRRRHRSGAPPANIEIQKELGKALRKQYDFPPPELPHQLLTLMIQLNAKDNDKE